MTGYLESGGEARYLGKFNEETGKWTDLIGHFYNASLASIDQAAIDRAATTLKPDVGPATINRQVYGPMAAVLHHAAARGLCAEIKVKRRKQPKRLTRWLKPAEAEKLITACSPHLRPLVIFMLYTGGRVSEAVYLDWNEVDLRRRRVIFLDTKNGTDRGVPLHARAVAELASLDHREGAVFRRPDGKPYERRKNAGGVIQTAFAGALRRAGIKRCRPHDLRHTWATWFYAENRDLRALMELGGWKSISMVERYTHVNPDHLKGLIARLPNWAKSVQHKKKKVVNG